MTIAFDSLPPCVIVRIFQFLDLKSSFQCLFVNREFRLYALDNFDNVQRLNFREFVTTTPVCPPSVRNYSLLLQCFRNLRQLTLYNSISCDSGLHFFHYGCCPYYNQPGFCGCICLLERSYSQLVSASGWNLRLQTLTIYFRHPLTASRADGSHFLVPFPRQLTQLTSLQLSFFFHEGHLAGCNGWFQAFPNLQELTLESVADLSVPQVYESIFACAQLKTLKLYGCEVNGEFFAAVFSRLTQLEKLEVVSYINTEITPAVLRQGLRQLGLLRQLTVQGTFLNISSADVPLLKRDFPNVVFNITTTR